MEETKSEEATIARVSPPSTCDVKDTQGRTDDKDVRDSPIAEITPFKAYVQVALLFVSVCFGNLPFFSLLSVQTSLNGLLGSVTGALSHFCWVVGSLLTQNIISVLGLKVTIVSHHWLVGLYVLGYYYRSWPTLLIGNIVIGWADGPALAAASVYANIIACSLAKIKGKDAKHYVGIFQGLATSGALYGGAVLGNGLSSVIFLLDESYNTGNVTTLTNATNSSFTFSNTTTSDSCDSGYAQQTVSDQAYYILLGVCTVFQLISIVSVLGVMSIPGRTATCKSLKHTCLQVKSSLMAAFKTFAAVKYMLVMPVGFYCGLEAGYILAVYSKVFIANCVGIGYVGVVTMLQALFTVLSAVAAAKVMVHMSRSVLSIFLFTWTLILLFFMMFWTRQPNLIIIFLLDVGMGVSNGSWYALGLAYLGVVGNKESESVLSTYWAARALGATVMFFLSITDSVSVQIPLGVLLTTFVIGYVLYLAAECVFGERLSFCKFNSMCPPKNGAISVSNSLAVSDNINMTIQPVSDYEVT